MRITNTVKHPRRLMKVAIPAVCGVIAVSILLEQSHAADQPKPGPEHQRMEVFVGDWSYEGSTSSSPFWPVFTYKGYMTNRMVLGGFFLELSGQDKSNTDYLYQLLALQGFDAKQKTYVGTGFENDGSVQGPYTIAVDGNTWTRTGTRSDDAGKAHKSVSEKCMTPGFTHASRLN